MSRAEEVSNYLIGIGYTPIYDDLSIIEILITEVENAIKIDCNITELPEMLNNVVICRTVGRFLEIKASNGSLYDTLNIDYVAKKIVEGDTTVEMAVPDGQTPRKAMSDYIKTMKEYGKRQIAAFRKLKW